MTFDAATKKTCLYVNGKLDAEGTANQSEPYQLTEAGSDTRNYIGRTQWWDSNVKADNVDFVGTISGFRLYDIALTRDEIAQIQSDISGIVELSDPHQDTLADTLYDLQGRKLESVHTPGIYIANGQKMLLLRQ